MSGVNDDENLRRVAQAAEQQALRIGKSELASSIELLYRRSHSDPRLKYLMLKILGRRHTIGEGIEFQAYVYMSKRIPRVKSFSTRTTRNSQGLRLPYVRKKNAAIHAFTTQASLLLALPAELREIIYGYVVGPNRDNETLTISRDNIKERIGLLGACRQIRFEASTIFYHDSTRFEAVINGDISEPVVGWFKSIGVQACQRLRCVSLRHEIREKDKSECRRNNTNPLPGRLIGSVYMAQEILAPPLVKGLIICGVPVGSISTPESRSVTYANRQKLGFLAHLTDANWSREVSKAIASEVSTTPRD